MTQAWTTEWIDTQPALDELCQHLKEQPFIAVDTEFHRERTYYAQLALVQVASATRVACIDPLAKIDLAPIDEIMQRSALLKVVHAGRQDLEIFYDRTGAVPGPVFDTQVAAGLLGHGDQLGYGPLVAKVCGVQLKKLHGRTDWMRRPLDGPMVEYAALDVVHLRDVYLKLSAELDRLGRAAWLEEEQGGLTGLQTYAPPLDDAWKRVKGFGRLRGVECAAARGLGAWREEKARALDRPRRRVLSDEALLDLARQRPKSIDAMKRLRALDAGVRSKFGQELAEVIAAAEASPKDTWPAPPSHERRDPVDGALVDALSAVLSVRGRDGGVSPKMLCSRGELEQVASGDEEVPVLRGWRRELAGAALLTFLSGELRLEVVDGALNLVEAGAAT